MYKEYINYVLPNLHKEIFVKLIIKDSISKSTKFLTYFFVKV
jgi:hypothetical protein